MPPSNRSFSRDRSVVHHQLRPGTIRRIVGFARPYRGAMAVFLVLVIVDALAGAATPLVYRAIIDHGIEDGRTGLVVALAALVAALAVLSAPSAWPSAGSPPASARASSTICAPRSSTTCSGCRSASSAAPRPAPS